MELYYAKCTKRDYNQHKMYYRDPLTQFIGVVDGMILVGGEQGVTVGDVQRGAGDVQGVELGLEVTSDLYAGGVGGAWVVVGLGWL